MQDDGEEKLSPLDEARQHESFWANLNRRCIHGLDELDPELERPIAAKLQSAFEERAIIAGHGLDLARAGMACIEDATPENRAAVASLSAATGNSVLSLPGEAVPAEVLARLEAYRAGKVGLIEDVERLEAQLDQVMQFERRRARGEDLRGVEAGVVASNQNAGAERAAVVDAEPSAFAVLVEVPDAAAVNDNAMDAARAVLMHEADPDQLRAEAAQRAVDVQSARTADAEAEGEIANFAELLAVVRPEVAGPRTVSAEQENDGNDGPSGDGGNDGR